MKIVFTLCSNNYLAQAKTLGDSIKNTNPGYDFYIGLADKLSNEIDYDREIGHTIIPSEEIGIPDFDSLWQKYSIIEFNTCIKPFYFQYFINRYPDLEYLFFVDPDTFFFSSLKLVEQEFGAGGRILLTPHITTPIQLDGKTPNENAFLNVGVYNLGFIGLKYPQQINNLLEWWKDRTYYFGYNQVSNGMFVDQLWLNFAPVYFNKVVISKHLGLNMAPWNLHERRLSEINNVFVVNNSFPLIFYHFSAYKYTDSNTITRDFTRYNFETNGDLKKIYQKYHHLLLANGIERMECIKCSYMAMKEKHKRGSSIKNMITYYLKKILPNKIIQIVKVIAD